MCVPRVRGGTAEMGRFDGLVRSAGECYWNIPYINWKGWRGARGYVMENPWGGDKWKGEDGVSPCSRSSTRPFSRDPKNGNRNPVDNPAGTIRRRRDSRVLHRENVFATTMMSRKSLFQNNCESPPWPCRCNRKRHNEPLKSRIL